MTGGSGEPGASPASRPPAHPPAYAAGVDLGGSKIAAGIVASDGRLLAARQEPTHPEEGPEGVLARIVAGVRAACREAGLSPGELAGVGVGCPGPLDYREGRVIQAPNLGWHDVPVAAPLAAALGLPVWLENDANAAALAENRWGAGAGARHMLYLGVGTGIGSGLVLDGKVYRGGYGSAGEAGHVIVEPGGPWCNCGQRGCAEAIAGGAGLARRAAAGLRLRAPALARRVAAAAGGEGTTPTPGARLFALAGGDPDRVDARLVYEAARQGDPLARRLVDEAFRALGLLVASLVNLFDPERVVIGGGVASREASFVEAVREVVRLEQHHVPFDPARIVPAELGEEAGLYGAGLVGLEGGGGGSSGEPWRGAEPPLGR